MSYVYRNRDTGQVVEYEQRSARLDHLAHRWELVGEPEPEPEPEPVKPRAPRKPTS